jgi:Carboxypeptidase regulatory-like domain/TonB dependent receptor
MAGIRAAQREMKMERKHTPAGYLSCAVSLVLAALLLAFPVHAQETRGKITGRILDPSKKAVARASVGITDTERGTTVSSTTNDEGLFQANYLLPGTYLVEVEVAGFKKHIQGNVVLQIDESRDLAIMLEVGGVEEAITVTSEGLALNTSDASLGMTIDQRRLSDLPLIHGDPYKIMGLAPGLAHSGSQRLDRPFEPTHIVGFAYDGTRSNRSDLLIDGVPSTSTANANEVIASYVPPSDLVQEFKVQTATFDAQFGNTEGGVTSISIKSGTNRFHGSLYYFAEPVRLAANDFFGKARGQERVDSSSTRPGFTLTGPVRIPGLYDGRDKTFFTIGFERIEEERPRFDAGADVWVPTEALRRGDFSAYSSSITIYDPATRVPIGNGQFAGQPFPGNVIPQNRISPVSRAILDFYSLPKNPGLAGNIFDSTLPETTAYNTYTVRLDHQVSNNNKLFVRGSWYQRDSHSVDYFGTEATGTAFQFMSRQGVIDDVHIFNPTTALNVRYGYNRFIRNSGQEEDASNWDLTRTGFPAAYNDLVPEADRRFPRLDFPANTVLGTGQGGDLRPTTSHTVSATVNKSAGAHGVKFGGEMRIYREDSTPTGNDRSGQYIFNNTYTRQNSAAGTDFNGLQAYASFLLGLPSTTQIARSADYSEYSKTYGVFLQDDWRVSRRLTLNLGLRYELETPLVERNNKSVSGFDFDYVQPIQGTVQSRYAALNDPGLKALVPQLSTTGGLMFAGVDGGKGLYKTPKGTFLPRAGFAFQLNSKTVIRGGAGLFAGFLGQRRGDVITNGFSQTTVVGTTTNAAGAPVPRSWNDALLTTQILEPVGSAAGRQQGLGNNITFFNQNPGISKQLRWQMGFQRELPGGFVLEAAYVGNYGYDIELFRNINALPVQYLNADNSRTAAMNANNAFLTGLVTNPFAGLLPGSGINNPTIARSQLLRPYPAFQDITTSNNDGKSWYHSGQFSLQKRFSQGYTIGVAYTYSHWMQATEYLNAGDATPTKVVSDLDVPHRVSVSGIFELPFGKGRRFLSGGGISNVLFGGWQVQGVYTFQTGFPIPFGNPGAGTSFPPVASDAFYNGGDVSLPSDQQTTLRWFNTDAFTTLLNSNATAATPVNHLRTLPIRFGEARRDAINSIDLSLVKDLQLRGDLRIQLRAEFINAFNSPYFPNPVVNPTSSTFGAISASNQENYARRAQLGVKVVF